MLCNILQDLRYAGRNLWELIANGSVVAMAFLLFSDGVSKYILGTVSNEPKLVVVDIGFREGQIYQEVEPENTRVLEAVWSAGIYSEGRLVCNGSDRWEYSPKIEPIYMTPNQWTGDNCQMEEGVRYTARATWRWVVVNEEGEEETRSITERFQFIYRGV